MTTTIDSNPLPQSGQLSLFNVDDYNDHRPAPERVAAAHGFALAFHEDADGDIDHRWYAVQDWIRGVSHSDDPSKFWDAMKRRLKKAGVETSTWCRSLKYLATDGKTYKRDHAQAETLYAITQRMDANTPLRDAILRYLAKAGVRMDQYRRDPEKMVNDAIASFKKQGKDELWIADRLGGIVERNEFTASLKRNIIDLIPSFHYGQATNLVSRGLWHRDTKQLRQEIGIKPSQNLRDFQTRQALHYIGIAEATISDMLNERQSMNWQQAMEIIELVSAAIGVQSDALGKLMGIDLATGKPLLTGGAR